MNTRTKAKIAIFIAGAIAGCNICMQTYAMIVLGPTLGTVGNTFWAVSLLAFLYVLTRMLRTIPDPTANVTGGFTVPTAEMTSAPPHPERTALRDAMRGDAEIDAAFGTGYAARMRERVSMEEDARMRRNRALAMQGRPPIAKRAASLIADNRTVKQVAPDKGRNVDLED